MWKVEIWEEHAFHHPHGLDCCKVDTLPSPLLISLPTAHPSPPFFSLSHRSSSDLSALNFAHRFTSDSLLTSLIFPSHTPSAILRFSPRVPHPVSGFFSSIGYLLRHCISSSQHPCQAQSLPRHFEHVFFSPLSSRFFTHLFCVPRIS